MKVSLQKDIRGEDRLEGVGRGKGVREQKSRLSVNELPKNWNV